MKLEKKHLSNPQLVERVVKETGQLVDLLAAEPQLIARLFVTAGTAGVASRATAVVEQLPDHTLRHFVSEVIGCGKSYGGHWPGVFFRSCDFALTARLVRLLPDVPLDTAFAFTAGLFEHSAPGLMQCIREVAHKREQQAVSSAGTAPDARLLLVSDVLGDALGYQFNRGVVVMPRAKKGGPLHPKHASIAKAFGVPSLPELGNGGEIVDVKGAWSFRGGVEWVVPQELHLAATELVCISLSSFIMPKECRDLCERVGLDGENTIREIKAKWAEVVAMTGEGGLEAFRWLPAVGVHITPTICGRRGDRTGLKRIHVKPLPGDFPALSLIVVIDTYSIHMEYQDVIGVDGLLSGVDEPDEDTLPMQRGLNLLINRAVVGFMRSYVSSSSTCVTTKPKKHAGNGKTSRDGGDVAMCFPLLPKKFRRDGEPYSASAEAIERAMEYAGVELKPEMGRTFRTSPPITTKSEGYKPKPRNHVVEIA